MVVGIGQRLNTGAVGLLDTPEHDHACDFHYTLKHIQYREVQCLAGTRIKQNCYHG